MLQINFDELKQSWVSFEKRLPYSQVSDNFFWN